MKLQYIYWKNTIRRPGQKPPLLIIPNCDKDSQQQSYIYITITAEQVAKILGPVQIGTQQQSLVPVSSGNSVEASVLTQHPVKVASPGRVSEQDAPDEEEKRWAKYFIIRRSELYFQACCV